ncbi:unnamed protein product [Calypogeia fissa]
MGLGLSKRSGNRGVGRRHSWAAQQNAPVSLYNSFGGSFTCILHEFGSNNKCRSENYLQQKGTGAIVGLHSNWVGDSILACARPSDRMIKDHHLIHQFHSRSIVAVINLQEPGEHAGCGDGVLPETGFAYNPELFTQDNIVYFNFPWRDIYFMDEKLALSICQAMDSKIATGAKVAVHCHSGIGRTGLVIACFFLYSGSYDAPLAAVRAVRTDRPGALKGKSQEQLVKKFDTYVRTLKIIYVPPEKRKKNLNHGETKSYPTLVESMARQIQLLYGPEKHALQYVPKILDWITRDLIRRTEFDRSKREQISETFMRAFTTVLHLSIDDEPVQRAKVRINAGDWSGVEELDTSVLCHLLLEWLYQLQEPIVPDSILTTALGRGDIESAIDELSKCDQCSFASLQCLVCWMFQIVPAQPKLIRRLYSTLAHVLLANTTLQNDPRSPHGDSNNFLKNWMRRKSNVYTAYKPSLLEIEFGLLLEAIARFWIKLGVARHEQLENKNKQTVNTTAGPSAPSSTLPSSLGTLALKLRDRHRIGSFSQPWFRDRASLQYEQYNPGSTAEYLNEMERGSIGGSPASPMPSRFAERKQKPVVKKGELNTKKMLQEEKAKRVPQLGQSKIEAQQATRKVESSDKKKEPVDNHEIKKAVAQEERKKAVAQEEKKKKPVGPETKKKLPSGEVKKEGASQREKKVVKGVQAKQK